MAELARAADLLQWVEGDQARAEAARFFARVVGSDDRYISHGEIQCGLSEDGAHWAVDLEARFLEDLAECDPEVGLLTVHDGPALSAAAIVRWTVTPRVSFATIEDMAVDPAARSRGLGATMIAAIEKEAQARGMRWLFLESGKDNDRAHLFFERHGFHTVSHVFARKL